MRIDLNQGAQPLSDSSQASNLATTGDGSSRSGAMGEDQTQLSGVHVQVQTLATQALQLPEIRQERVNALRQTILGGDYQLGSNQVAEAVFGHMLVMPAA
jgi:flagellar biosynthesis anti-sigma factor FlgM